MQKYTYVVGQTFINLTNIETGESHLVYSGDDKFDTVYALIKNKQFEEAELALSVKAAIQKCVDVEPSATGDIRVFIADGAVRYSYKGGAAEPLNNAIVDRIVELANSGFDVSPMCRFMENLLANPLKSAIDELYLFLDACRLPITDDGHFIAYKLVRSDYKDIYTGTMDNKVGTVVEMMRSLVDTDRNNTCSVGLHFCSKSYLPKYGSDNRDSDRVLLVKINPADVVAIPSDYNNAKGRAWRYEVVGEVKGGRSGLSGGDFTTSPVVASTPVKASGVDAVGVHVEGVYFYNTATHRWHTVGSNAMVSVNSVLSVIQAIDPSVTLADVMAYMQQ